MLAGLPKAPSRLQPGRQPEARASSASSTSCGACTSSATSPTAQYEEAKAKSRIRSRRDSNEFGVHAEYVAEMARQADRRAVSRTTSTRAASTSTPPSARPTRTPPTRRCAGRARLRPAPRLPRARKASSSCRRSRTRTTTRSKTELAEHPDSDDLARRHRRCRPTPKQVEAASAHRRESHHQRRGAALRRGARSIPRPAPQQRIRPRRDHPRAARVPSKPWQHRAAAGGGGGLHRRSTRRTARSARWSAASTSTATSSTT